MLGERKSEFKDKTQMLQEMVTIENSQDLEYLGWVMYEGLRFLPPAISTSDFVIQEDFKSGQISFKKDERVVVYIEALHHNSSEWQRPEEYLPDRFNPESELYLTPSGKKRNSYSFVPFSGGKRICFGKTFAEMNLRYLATYMS